jgi:hypothetical protein
MKGATAGSTRVTELIYKTTFDGNGFGLFLHTTAK